MLSSRRRVQNAAMKNQVDGANAGAAAGKLHITLPQGGRVLEFAARELAAGLGRMLSEPVAVQRSDDLRAARLVLNFGAGRARFDDWSGAGYAIIPARHGI